MNIVPFSAWYPDLDKISSPDNFFGTVKERYTQYHEEGYFKKYTQKVLFAYRIVSKEDSYLGLLTTIPTSEYINGNILKHEKTLARKEEKTIQLLLERQANVKPILLTYPSVDTINRLLKGYITQRLPSYTVHFEQEQATHSIWTIENTSLIEQLQGIFKKAIPSTFIADGHHRTSSMNRLYAQNGSLASAGDFNHLLVALFGSNQLKIAAFNRIVKGVSYISPSEFFEAAEQYCTIESSSTLQSPPKKHNFFVNIRGDNRLLTWKKEVLQEYAHAPAVIDVQLLNDKILNNILGIKEVRTDKRIKYIPSVEGVAAFQKELLKNTDAIGFYLHPIPVEDLMSIVQHHQMLPPKSTYFEPRMKNGLVVKRFK